MGDLIIGMGLQRAYLHPTGCKYIGDSADTLKSRLEDFLDSEGDGKRIVFTREIHQINDEFFKGERSNSIVGSLDIEIIESLKRFPKLLVNVCRYNALYMTPLDSELKKYKPSNIILVGVETHTNILFTAEELRNRNYNVVVVEALTSSKDSYMHASGINILSNTLSTFIE